MGCRPQSPSRRNVCQGYWVANKCWKSDSLLKHSSLTVKSTSKTLRAYLTGKENQSEKNITSKPNWFAAIPLHMLVGLAQVPCFATSAVEADFAVWPKLWQYMVIDHVRPARCARHAHAIRTHGQQLQILKSSKCACVKLHLRKLTGNLGAVSFCMAVCVYAFVWRECVYVCVHACVYMSVSASVYVCVSACVCVCVCVCVLCVCVRASVLAKGCKCVRVCENIVIEFMLSCTSGNDAWLELLFKRVKKKL